MRERVKLEVIVDLDSFPGAMHTLASASECVQAVLLGSIGHYNPVVMPAPPDALADMTRQRDEALAQWRSMVRQRDDAKATALREAAEAWQEGGWSSDLPPKGYSRPQLILGMAQRAGDWLRARADALDAPQTPVHASEAPGQGQGGPDAGDGL